MSLDRLAQVELQLVMQHCDSRSLFALARCSRFTFAAASHPFAWRFAPPLVIRVARWDGTVPLSPDSESASPRRRLLCCACPLFRSAAAPLFPPGVVARRSLLHHADQLVRWNAHFAYMLADDANNVDVARRVLHSLPRLVALDLSDTRLSATSKIVRLLCDGSARSLTALDIRGLHLWQEEMLLVTQTLPRLRTLRCRVAGSASACLQTLAGLAHLSDLAIMPMGLAGTPEDFAILDQCRSLRRLAISDQFNAQGEIMTAVARLRQLRELTLQYQSDHDWPAIFAGLHSLRRLTLDRCEGAAAMLDALAADVCPQLRLLRIGLPLLTDTHSWTDAFRTESGPSPLLAAISALLQRRLAIRVQLRIGFELAGVSASWLLPLHSECDWRSATPQWTDFELLHSPHREFRHLPLLFADDGLGSETPLEDE